MSSESVQDAEKVRGDELYLALGKSDKTADCLLTSTNFIERASLFFDKRICNPALADLDYVLKEMLQTGKFSIHGSFFHMQGAMVYSRAQTAFQCRVFPSQTSVSDVHRIMFTTRHIRDDIAQSVDRDADDDFDPFEAQSAYVTLDRTFHTRTTEEPGHSRAATLPECDSTEARSNADARPPPSIYETIQSFTQSTSDPQPSSSSMPASSSPSRRQHDYSETAWDIAGDVSRIRTLGPKLYYSTIEQVRRRRPVS